MSEIRNRRVLITGAAAGMGRLIAHRFTREGARVILVDVNADGLEQLIRELPGAEPFICDVSIREEVRRLRAKTGPIDILVNNAGLIAHGAFAEVNDEDDERMVVVNCLGVHWMTKTYLPDLVASEGGHLVQMASAASIIGVPYQSVYSATKWFVAGLSDALRQELRADGQRHVRVTIVCPGVVGTGFYDRPKPPLFIPVLEPETVAERIVTAVKRNKPYVRAPVLVKLSPFLRAILPMRASDAIAAALGLHRIVPRQPRSPRESVTSPRG